MYFHNTNLSTQQSMILSTNKKTSLNLYTETKNINKYLYRYQKFVSCHFALNKYIDQYKLRVIVIRRGFQNISDKIVPHRMLYDCCSASE